ncbi:Hypothetical predicted protein [Cloeon dipterum]|uniref:Coiled-coil-helix-coiled-coil-helix domain-containing protein 7 n=1 Tax=Cloeon dipterum TaxID=197152 RepID=A0A8S1D5U0_9INSE|nr:Hypothetical predicted protein [Cloeon dipterum]
MRNDPAKLTSEYNNPCLKEQELSFKCMHDNNFDRDSCTNVFKNYQVCKEFWNHIKVQRRRDGIKPYMPPPEERDQIKSDYLNSRKKW